MYYYFRCSLTLCTYTSGIQEIRSAWILAFSCPCNCGYLRYPNHQKHTSYILFWHKINIPLLLLWLLQVVALPHCNTFTFVFFLLYILKSSSTPFPSYIMVLNSNWFLKLNRELCANYWSLSCLSAEERSPQKLLLPTLNFAHLLRGNKLFLRRRKGEDTPSGNTGKDA